MTGASGNKNGVKHSYYVCTKRVKHGKKESPCRTVR